MHEQAVIKEIDRRLEKAQNRLEKALKRVKVCNRTTVDRTSIVEERATISELKDLRTWIAMNLLNGKQVTVEEKVNAKMTELSNALSSLKFGNA